METPFIHQNQPQTPFFIPSDKKRGRDDDPDNNNVKLQKTIEETQSSSSLTLENLKQKFKEQISKSKECLEIIQKIQTYLSYFPQLLPVSTSKFIKEQQAYQPIIVQELTPLQIRPSNEVFLSLMIKAVDFQEEFVKTTCNKILQNIPNFFSVQWDSSPPDLFCGNVKQFLSNLLKKNFYELEDWIELSRLLNHCDLKEDARQALEIARNKDPESFAVFEEIVLDHCKQENFTKAYDCLLNWEGIVDENYWLLAAMVDYRKGKLEESLEKLDTLEILLEKRNIIDDQDSMENEEKWDIEVDDDLFSNIENLSEDELQEYRELLAKENQALEEKNVAHLELRSKIYSLLKDDREEDAISSLVQTDFKNYKHWEKLIDYFGKKGRFNAVEEVLKNSQQSVLTQFEKELLEARYYFLKDDKAKTSNLLYALSVQNPTHPGILFLKAQNAYFEKKFLVAKGYLEELVKTDFTHHNAWSHLGDVYFREQDWKNANRAYKKSLETDPNQNATLKNLAVSSFNLKEYDLVIKCCKRLSKLDLNNPFCISLWGRSYFEKYLLWENEEDETKKKIINPQNCDFLAMAELLFRDIPDINMSTQEHFIKKLQRVRLEIVKIRRKMAEKV